MATDRHVSDNSSQGEQGHTACNAVFLPPYLVSTPYVLKVMEGSNNYGPPCL